MRDQGHRKGLYRLAVLAAVWGVILIKWGAVVTTENAGMAFPDWPLSNGSVNPEGWLEVWPLFLEHGHRILGAGMGVLSILLVAWAWFSKSSRLVLGLTIAALAAVILQGVMGGIRVLRISDGCAIFHGVFAQVFFCLLLLIVMATAPGWPEGNRLYPAERISGLRGRTLLLLGAVGVQLFLGAGARHLHRTGLVATDYPTMNGAWLPSLEYPEVAFHFLHRWWAFAVLAAAVGCVEFLRRPGDERAFRRTAATALVLIVAQMLFGIGVVLMGTAESKNLWVTTLHVLNGLAVLAAAFVLCVQSMRAVPRGPLLAGSGETKRRDGKGVPEAAA
ncbi:MAG TPA: COX15/CtaA family protein [Verrucomicrobiales bacterium]|nr:COX15/CtaA family protein [Verrucomicrobiales bacterium]